MATNITIDLDEILTKGEQQRIAQLLPGIDDPVRAFCKAAIGEFADAIISRRTESAASTPEHRLYRIMRHALNGEIPSESVVSDLFGISEKQAGKMIAKLARRYNTLFDAGWVTAITKALDSKEPVGDEALYRFSASPTLVEHLRPVIEKLLDGKLAPIKKVKDMAGRYLIAADTYRAVCEHFHIPHNEE